MMNLQDSFLNQVRKDNTEIIMVLISGGRITGHVRGFDNFTVIIRAQDGQHLVYKHAIAQLINKFDDRERSTNSGSRHEGARQDESRVSKPRQAAGGKKFNTMDLTQVKMEDEESKKAKDITASVSMDTEKPAST